MTRVKICGLTRTEDAALVVGHGAWALGMIMWKGSPRYCPPQRAADIVARHRREVETVGVFVDAKLDELTSVVDAVGFSVVQLHGDEGQQYCLEVARRTGAKIIKVFRVRDRSVLNELGLIHDVDFHLLDTYKAGVPGGTGETFEWSFLGGRESRAPLILSGGLTPANVGAAILTVNPFAVDVSSGVEVAPGIKDPAKLEQFFEQVASASPVADTTASVSSDHGTTTAASDRLNP